MNDIKRGDNDEERVAREQWADEILDLFYLYLYI